MTAKELRNKFVLSKPRKDSITQFKSFYHITPEQLDEYIERVCEEQKENCIKSFPSHEHSDIIKAINNTPKPEYK